jgi:hypothetical protein
MSTKNTMDTKQRNKFIFVCFVCFVFFVIRPEAA